MELIFIVIALFIVASLVMPWVNHGRLRSLRDEIERLRNEVKYLGARVGHEYVLPAMETATTKAEEKETEEIRQEIKHPLTQNEEYFDVIEDDEETWQPQPVYVEHPQSSVPRASGKDWTQTIQNSFEKNLATKLPVWIGALSLIFAAFFLVKYSIELGWMKPEVRLGMGGLFGVALLAAGQWVMKRNHIANSLRISQGLVGAGLVALYVSIYAAVNLYELVPTVIGFGGMSIVTALAVILSLRHGQPIAVFGLVGGLLTPALVSSHAPNAAALFTYLFLLFGGMFTVLTRKGWWTLAIMSVIGVFLWSAFWFLTVFTASDGFVLVLFSMGIAALVLAATGKRVVNESFNKEDKLPVISLNITAIAGGVMTIAWLSLAASLTLFDWSMMGLLSMAAIALAVFQPSVYRNILWVKLGTSLVLFFFWAQHAALSDAVAVIAGISAIYVGGSAFIMRRVNSPEFWAQLQAMSAVVLYMVSYHVLKLPVSMMENADMFWGVIALLLAGSAIYQAVLVRKNFAGDKKTEDHLVAVYALASSAFISLGLAIVLPWGYLPLAIAGQVAATALVYQRTEIDALKKIMLILTLGFAVLNYNNIFLFGNIVMDSIFMEKPSKYIVGNYDLATLWIKLGLSSVLLSFALGLMLKRNDRDEKLVQILFAAAATLAAATGYILLRTAFHLDQTIVMNTTAGFIERGVITASCALAGMGIIRMVKDGDWSFVKPWGYGLFYLATARFVFFDLLQLNPYWADKQFVGDIPLFNGITLTYGIGGLMAAWAVRTKGVEGKPVYTAIGLASLFALSSLTVRQYFHGGFLGEGSVTSSEFYAYSVAWLLTGLALLAYGIKFDRKPARMASLAFMVLTIGKVFLVDASELEGLYRVFSFLGLGVSLIGLSYFYTKFVFAGERAIDKS